ncbi:LON peptidase substrate-binding domain-containing protein [Shewanella sp.]|uniref:LON peptidase substrate-binding domain-containing protein n=1 Tax=Shewanella sp. TaxID=50422 RepID=UPI00356AFF09
MQLALFPLPVCLLPGGTTQLRIFEPRYKRLVSESLRTAQGFALCMLGTDNQPLPVATRVEIVDFETVEDGLLGITVQGKERLEVLSWQTESDGLKLGTVRTLPPWSSQPITRDYKELSDKLSELFKSYPRQSSFIEQDDFNNLTWVCQRWLEILPIGLEHKQRCYRADNVELTLSLLEQIFEKN